MRTMLESLIEQEDRLTATCASVVGPENAKAMVQRRLARVEKETRDVIRILRMMRPEVERVMRP